jgi:hypothetical protein
MTRPLRRLAAVWLGNGGSGHHEHNQSLYAQRLPISTTLFMNLLTLRNRFSRSTHHLLYMHHVLYLTVVAPIWIYGFSKYSGNPSPSMHGNGNHGPLAYSPLLNVLLDSLVIYIAACLITLCISVVLLSRKRGRRYTWYVLLDILLPILLVPLSLVAWIVLEEG